jgi:hypothetical protein
MESNLEPGLKNLYQQTETRKNWNNPSHEEMVRSLNKAHTVNKALVRNVDELLSELRNERKWRKRLMFAFGATWAGFAWVLKLIIPFAVKGMLK